MLISNHQSFATKGGLQQLLILNASKFSTYENGNLQNVEFFYSNGTIIPSWLEGNLSNELQTTNLNRSSRIVYWLKLAPSISAGGNYVVYVGFAPKNVSFLNGVTVGEAPELSSPYGRYDNGGQVFTNGYWDFSGSSFPSGINSIVNNGTVSVNNELTIIGGRTQTPGENGAAAPNIIVNESVDFYGTLTTSPVGDSWGWSEDGISNCTNKYNAHLGVIGCSDISVDFEGSAGGPNCTIAGGFALRNAGFGGTCSLKGVPLNTGNYIPAYNGYAIFSFVFTPDNAILYTNYTDMYANIIYTQNTIKGLPFAIAVGNNEGTYAPNGEKIYWLRYRQTPPNGIMPNTSVGGASSVITARSPITLYNNQPVGTSSNFQQMLPINSSKYTAYEANNLQNVEFQYANGTVIPSWFEGNPSNETRASNLNASNNLVYWLKLGPSIRANGNLTIYIAFANRSVSLLNNITTGEAPQLSCTNPSNTATGCGVNQYGKYDDGGKVFPNYWNFNGTSLEGFSTPGGSGNFVVVNNGVVIGGVLNGTFPYIYRFTYNALSLGVGMIGYLNSSNGLFIFRGSNPNEDGIVSAFNSSMSRYEIFNYNNTSGLSSFENTGVPYSTKHIALLIYGNSTSIRGYAAGSFKASSTDYVQQQSTSIYVQGGAGYAQVIFTANTPPDGIMPTTSPAASNVVLGLSLSANQIVYGQPGTITAMASNNGIINIELNGNVVATGSSSTSYQVCQARNSSCPAAGTYSVVASSPDANYIVNKTLVIVQATPQLTLSVPSNYSFDQQPGNVIFGINTIDNQLNVTLSGAAIGTTNLASSALTEPFPGNYSATLYTPGNANYTPASRTANFSIFAQMTNITGIGRLPDALAFDSCNGYIYVANWGSNTVSVIDNLTVLGNITVGIGPKALQFDSANCKVYVADNVSNDVKALVGFSVVSTTYVGADPFAMALDPVNKQLYVADFGSGQVSLLNTNTTNSTLVGNIMVGAQPIAILYNPVKNDTYVADFGSNNVGILGKNAVKHLVAVQDEPDALAYNNSGCVYVANYGSATVSVICENVTVVVTNQTSPSPLPPPGGCWFGCGPGGPWVWPQPSPIGPFPYICDPFTGYCYWTPPGGLIGWNPKLPPYYTDICDCHGQQLLEIAQKPDGSYYTFFNLPGTAKDVGQLIEETDGFGLIPDNLDLGDVLPDQLQGAYQFVTVVVPVAYDAAQVAALIYAMGNTITLNPEIAKSVFVDGNNGIVYNGLVVDFADTSNQILFNYTDEATNATNMFVNQTLQQFTDTESYLVERQILANSSVRESLVGNTFNVINADFNAIAIVGPGQVAYTVMALNTTNAISDNIELTNLTSDSAIPISMIDQSGVPILNFDGNVLLINTTVSGTNVGVQIPVKGNSTTGIVVFVAGGLPSPIPGEWGVRAFGKDQYSNNNTITYSHVQIGTYNDTEIIQNPGGYRAELSYMIDLSVFCFELYIHVPFWPVTYNLTFVAQGLPSGTPWGVSLFGIPLSTTSNSITLHLPNGDWQYAIDAPLNYSAKPPGGAALINNSGGTIYINFSRLPSNTRYAPYPIPVGKNPIALLFDKNDCLLYVANYGSNSVSVVQGLVNIGNLSVGVRPTALALANDTGWLYVANKGSGSLSVINITREIATLSVGANPVAMVYDPLNKYIYVSQQNASSSIVSVVYHLSVLTGGSTSFVVPSSSTQIPVNNTCTGGEYVLINDTLYEYIQTVSSPNNAGNFTTANIISTSASNLTLTLPSNYKSFFFTTSSYLGETTTTPKTSWSAFTYNVEKTNLNEIRNLGVTYVSQNASATGISLSNSLQVSVNVGGGPIAMAGLASSLPYANVIAYNSVGLSSEGTGSHSLQLSFPVNVAGDAAYILGAVSSGSVQPNVTMPNGCSMAQSASVDLSHEGWVFAANCIFSSGGTFSANYIYKGAGTATMAVWVFNTSANT
ncbi:MAG TPA: hypothetical protein VL944_01425 [Candidatus Acidoferrum sp.]|nr:hypothetical protein [Candidatus Acidoferrum sp.]